MQLNKKSMLWASCGVGVFCVISAGMAFAGGEEQETTIGLPAPLLVKAINAASEAKAGNITEVEVEREDGQTKVEVKILASDGQTYEVSVEAATNKVLSVEKDDDDNETDDKN